MEVIFEDNHLLVINKAPGYLTQVDDEARASLEAWARGSGRTFAFAAHRLDRWVSGCVVIAKSSKALKRLQASFREKKVGKRYLAIVEGVPENCEDRLVSWLSHGRHRAHLVAEGVLGAKPASLQYTVLCSLANYALLEVHLETGRYHQIRAQLAGMGHPVLGDQRYGSSCDFGNEGLALHHYAMDIPHPVGGDVKVFEAVWNLSDSIWQHVKELAVPPHLRDIVRVPERC